MDDPGALPRLLLVDDDVDMRYLAMTALPSAFRVVGEAGSVAGTLELARSLEPDVVLLDRRLPDGDGVELAGVLRGFLPEALLVLHTAGAESEPVGPPVDATLEKSPSPSRLVEALRALWRDHAA